MILFSYAEFAWSFRNPLMGNEQNLTFQRINRHTRGGDLIVFRDADWPKTEELVITFSFDQETDAIKMKEMLRITLGQVITYVDHESITWSGYIKNPDTAVTQVGRNSYNIQINFEGEQV